MNSYSHHFSATSSLNTDPKSAFEYLDDPRKLSTHMEKSSWMMAGSKMEMKLDDKKGRAVGSIIVLAGKMMGIPLFVQEIITQREPYQSKEWETFGEQKMLILDQYKMGFRLNGKNGGTELQVYIDYSLPQVGANRILSRIFSRIYARWCTRKMAQDAAAHFS